MDEQQTLKARPSEEKRMPHGQWQKVEVTFSAAHTDKVIPHTLNPATPDLVKWEVMDRNNPGSIYRGAKASATDYIVLRSTEVGEFHIRLYIPAHYEGTKLKTTSSVSPYPLSKVLQNAQTAYKDEGNVFTLAGNTFNELLTVAKGLTFPATQVASSGANDLDDYEEGTWTPTIGDDAGTPINAASYGIQVGRYVKIGKVVLGQFRVDLTAIGAPLLASGGNIQLGGLPFTSENTTNLFGGGIITYFINMGTNWNYIGFRVDVNGTRGYLIGTKAAGVTAALMVPADLTNTTTLIGVFFYRASA